MASERGKSTIDLWSEIVASEEDDQQQQQPQQDPEVAVIYRRRRRAENTDQNEQIIVPSKGDRASLAPTKRISWNRSLSTRGRSSILVSGFVDYQPNRRQKQAKKRPKKAVPNRKNVKPTSYDKERAYFQEVDSFELLEESPSPKNFGTWAMGVQREHFVLPEISSRLGKWLAAKRLNYSCGPSSSLTNILETPIVPMGSICSDASVTPERVSRQFSLNLHSTQNIASISADSNVDEKNKCWEEGNVETMHATTEGFEDVGEGLKRLSLTPRSASLHGDLQDPYASLLRACKQSSPSTLLELFSQYCDPGSIVKVGEGTYGEAFKAGSTVCKIVPIDGDLLVNGEVQKRSAELLEEVVLSMTLNHLREQDQHIENACTTYIETLDVQVCQGSYDAALIKAWEEWDSKHGSENDHPKEFPDKQCYVVFVLAHGGEDLENFVLLNFQEAQSLLVQVTAALAVGEAAYEFEHRDLHWGNILLSRNEASTVQFTLEGKQSWIRTFGLSISIIDFTLSRINTGEAIFFLDLSSDPALFEGPKADKQSETYRKMKEVTEECWEGSFPRTNVLWLQYLIDILLLKKSFLSEKRTAKHDRELRSLKKRLNSYSSAREAILDPFFSELFVEQAM